MLLPRARRQSSALLRCQADASLGARRERGDLQGGEASANERQAGKRRGEDILIHGGYVCMAG